MNAAKAIAEARSYIGVPWRHRGRSRFGIDCIGLIVNSMAAGGIVMRDRRDYGREPWRDGLQREMIEHFGGPVTDLQAGYVVLMRFEDHPEPGHVGIIGDYAHGGLSLIHSYSRVAVCEHRLDDAWRARIIEGYNPWQ